MRGERGGRGGRVLRPSPITGGTVEGPTDMCQYHQLLQDCHDNGR